MQYVYLMKATFGEEHGNKTLYKIGISDSPTRRAVEIGKQRGVAVTVVSEYPSDEFADLREKSLHSLFHDYWVFGEWFDLQRWVDESNNGDLAAILGSGWDWVQRWLRDVGGQWPITVVLAHDIEDNEDAAPKLRGAATKILNDYLVDGIVPSTELEDILRKRKQR